MNPAVTTIAENPTGAISVPGSRVEAIRSRSRPQPRARATSVAGNNSHGASRLKPLPAGSPSSDPDYLMTHHESERGPRARVVHLDLDAGARVREIDARRA